MTISIDLSGMNALVTGGGRGIGRAIAVMLAKAGADVCVTSRTQSQLEETAELIGKEGRKAIVAPGDITDSIQVDKVVKKTLDELGGIDILINNAGVEHPSPLLDLSEKDYEKVMDSNMKSMFLCIKAVGPHMIAKKFGRIVNTSSTGGFIAGPNHAVYHASKAANAHFTRAMAYEWARYNITVNAVAPGWIDTDLISFLTKDPEKLKQYVKSIPMRRLGKPEEIAGTVAFLCSKLASYITGAIVFIDGGLMIP